MKTEHFGYLLLEGGAEFGGGMAEPDRHAMDLAGGPEARIAILPTAAAPDKNHERAGRNGARWFRSLGATNVEVVPVIDKSSANDPALALRLRSARFIYILGGFPHYLGETLRGTRIWQAVIEAYEQGSVIGGSSAGAMVLCEHYYDPQAGQLLPGLNLLRNACVLPHHNGFGKNWSQQLVPQLPQVTLLGIDEQTGLLAHRSGAWTIHGAGKVTLYSRGQVRVYQPGDTLTLPDVEIV